MALLAGCATPEYTTSQARDDLVRKGWTSAQAQCFVDGLHKYYADQYLAINRRQAALRHLPFTGVNPQGTDLYVRNELTSGGGLTNTEVAEAHTLARRCHG